MPSLWEGADLLKNPHVASAAAIVFAGFVLWIGGATTGTTVKAVDDVICWIRQRRNPRPAQCRSRNGPGDMLRRTRSVGLIMTAAVLLAVFAAPAHADPGCTNGQPDATPRNAGEQVIVDYFHAVNDRNYGIAWGYLGPSMHDMYGSLPKFVAIMNEHLKCVRVTGFLPVDGPQSFRVVFDDEYLVPFGAGSGGLPLFYKVSADRPPLIVEQATSPLT